jgi:hypothetical protein
VVPTRLKWQHRRIPTRLVETDSDSIVPVTSLSTTDLPPLPPPQTDLRAFSSTVARPRPSGKLGSTVYARATAASGAKDTFAVGLALIRLEQLDGVFSIGQPIPNPAPLEEDTAGLAGESGVSAAGGNARTLQATDGARQPKWLVKGFMPEWWGDRAKQRIQNE